MPLEGGRSTGALWHATVRNGTVVGESSTVSVISGTTGDKGESRFTYIFQKTVVLFSIPVRRKAGFYHFQEKLDKFYSGTNTFHGKDK